MVASKNGSNAVMSQGLASAGAKKKVTPVTTLEVTLSDKLQDTLGQKGVNGYVVYFEKDATGSSDAHWTRLVKNGNLPNGETVDIPLTETVNGVFDPMVGGKIYFLVQSGKKRPSHLSKVITEESEINWDNAAKHDFRYDSFEVTLNNASGDVGNLTSVNGFGLPMELEVAYDNGTTASRGYNISGAKLLKRLERINKKMDVVKYDSGPLKGEDRMAISPTTALAENLDNYAASDWNPYLNKLETMADDVVISGFFNGAPDAKGVYHNPGYYAYSLEWSQPEKVFWLTPMESSQIEGRIQLTETDLANSIYATLGHAEIYDGTEKFTSMGTGDNNQWGAVLSQFLTGFTGGYYGTTAKSMNPHVDEAPDLNWNGNWDPSYAFGKGPDSSKPEFFDKYSRAFFFDSNSYGSGYSDALMSQFTQGGPLIPVSEPDNPDGQNVSKISLTIYDDKDRAKTVKGYTPTEIDNYIAPGKGGYATSAPGSSGQSGANITLNFANAEMVMKDDTPITLDFYQGMDGKNNPIWKSVTITKPKKGSLWQEWNIDTVTDPTTKEPIGFEAAATGLDKTAGSIVINQFPGMNPGVHWTRITIGEPGATASKTFNLYTTTDKKGFVNPQYGKHGDTLAIDGLAQIVPPTDNPNLITFPINFMHDATSTLPPELMEYNPDRTKIPTPAAPVVGTIDQNKFTGEPGQTSMIDPVVNTNKTELAFGWTGDNDMYESVKVNTETWIGGYTNKIGALHTAQVELVRGGTKQTPLQAVADLDGQWTTAGTQLRSGTYSVSMTELEVTGTNSNGGDKYTQIGKASHSLTLTVDAAELGLASAQGGQAVKLDTAGGAGKGVDGNWVKLDATQSPDDPGSSVAVVATDKTGALIHARTGVTGNVSLEDATLSTIGGMTLHDGQTSLQGQQSVYLPKGARLGFIELDSDGQAKGQKATVMPSDDGSARVRIGQHTLQATVDNAGTGASLLADAQQKTGEPLVYVAQGQQILVNLAGEAEGGNRLGFVRVDRDAETGRLSVDGLTQGQKGFKAAVRANLDGDFKMRGRGDFSKQDVWTVAGEDGFYAPVVLTRDGQVLFAPAENGNTDDGDAMRVLGQNFFAFEDGAGSRDFNDLTARMSPIEVLQNGKLDGTSTTPLALDGQLGVDGGARFVSDLDADRDPAFGLTLLSTSDDPAHLAVNGKAVFKGASGVKINGGEANVEIGNDGKLVLRGDGEVLHLSGDAGDVTIRNDGVIRGDISLGDGDDTVSGEGVFDSEVFLRRGNDTFIGTDNDDFIRGKIGDDVLRGKKGDDLLIAGYGRDKLHGGAGDDVLIGRRGAEKLFGGKGDDEVRGGRGDDYVRGGPGDDALYGGFGDDILNGGVGNDVLKGGRGADTFVMNLRNDNDRIRDFDVDSDRVDLSAFDLAAGTARTRIDAAMAETAKGWAELDLSELGGGGTLRFTGVDPTDAADINLIF